MGAIPRRAHMTPERTLQNLAIQERGAYISQVNKSLAPLEDWHVVGASGEVTTYSGGWRGDSAALPRFRKDNEGFVYLYGIAIYGGNAWGGYWSRPRVFVLPEGYRPPIRTYVGSPHYDVQYDSNGVDSWYWFPASVIVETDGRVRPLGGAQHIKVADLTGLVFRVDNVF